MRRILVFLGLLLTMLPAIPVAAQACGETALRAGLTVRVSSGVNLRAAPGLTARDIGGLSANDVVTLVGGPVCANAITWWQTAAPDAGWVAESSQSATYLEAVTVTPAELRASLDGLTVTLVAPAVLSRQADQCPPISGTISINYAGAADPFATGSEAAFFVDGGLSSARPAICLPSVRVQEASVTAPDGSSTSAAILPVAGAPDYLRATLPDTALLQPGLWRIALEDFTLDVRVTGPFAPLVDARIVNGTARVLLAGFAPSEQVALVGADVTEGAASNLRAVTVAADSHGALGVDLIGFGTLIAAVSESGLIALPPSIQSLDLAGAENRTAVYDALVIAFWGYEALGLPTPTPIPPTATPEPATATPEPTLTAAAPTATPEPSSTAVATLASTPGAEPTGIVNLPTAQPPTSVPDTTTPEGCTYTVKSGDTFYRIALSNGLTTAQLLAANPQITNPQVIFAGNILNIPGCGQGLP